jgi:cobalt/nickel transport system ATP-binding protein
VGEIIGNLTPLVFDIQNVTYRYDRTVLALDGLTLQIHPGQRVALLGANGSGKSTLLRILNGLVFPDSGTVSFAGDPLNETRLRDEQFRFDFRRRVGLVFQNPDVQLFNPTVFDEVAFGPLQLRWPREEITRKVELALATMGILQLKNRAPYHLSGGEKKRVALASVLVLEPSVLLLDEPTGGLDPRSQSQIIDLLSNHQAIQTVVIATHDLNIVEHIADHCHVMDAGRIAASGSPESILGDTALLQRTSLIHAHRHAHGSLVHSHPHLHGHEPHQH